MSETQPLTPGGRFRAAYHRFSDIFSKIIMALCMLIFTVMVYSVAYGVIGRYIPFIKNPRWTQELAILCMVWLCFLGAGYAIREGLHVRMTVMEYVLPKKVCKVLHCLAYVLLFVVNCFWICYGIEVVSLTKLAKMAATGWSLAITYLSIVVGGIYGAAMALDRILKGGW